MVSSNQNLSFREKWRRHVEKKQKEPKPWDNPVCLHRWGPHLFLFVYVGVGGWGAIVAIPALYKGGWEDDVVPSQAFAVAILVEVLVNWCLTRWVSSAYRPEIHGTKPSSDGAGSTSGSQIQAEKEEKGATEGDKKSSPGGKSSRANESNGTCERRANTSSQLANGKQSRHDSNNKANLQCRDKPSANKKRAYDGLSYTVWVATSLPTADGHVERKPVPYWSWVECFICNRLRPPRCHHCILCKCCVLKRDHHCYMTGACIGVNNQRHFIVFLVWAVIGCIFATGHMLPYTYLHVIPEYHVLYWDFVPPFCLVRVLLGNLHPIVFVLCVLFWFLLFFTCFTTVMLAGALRLFYLGSTGFERENGIKVTDTRTLYGKLHAVFGDQWWLNFLLPTVWTRPTEDAVFWPDIKP